MEIKQIDSETYDKQLLSEPDASIYQTPLYGLFSKENNDKLVFVTATDGHNLSVADAMFIMKKRFSLLGSTYDAYCPHGYLINYYDERQLKQFQDKLNTFMVEKKAVSLHIEPPVRSSAYIHGNLTDLGFNKEKEAFRYEIDLDHYRSENDDKIYNRVEETDDLQQVHAYFEQNELTGLCQALKPYVRFFVLYDEEDNIRGAACIADFSRQCEILFQKYSDEHVEKILIDHLCYHFKQKRYHTLFSSATIDGGERVEMAGTYFIRY